MSARGEGLPIRAVAARESVQDDSSRTTNDINFVDSAYSGSLMERFTRGSYLRLNCRARPQIVRLFTHALFAQ